MSLQRIWAVILRYLYTTRDPSRVTEFIFWPMIDIGFYGLIALWSGSLAKEPQLVRIFITALVLWQIIYRANFEICVNMVDEFLERNLMNLLTTPLKKSEWILGMMFSGLLKIIFTLIFGAAIGWLFFKINVFAIGYILFPFVLLCLVSGWIIGFIGAGLVIYKGSKFQQLPWVIIMIAAIFSSTFYPLSVLPTPLMVIAKSLPMSYIFEGMRELLTNGHISVYQWLMATILSILYLALAIKFFLFMFERSRNRGLTRLS